MVDNHGDHKSPKNQVVGPLSNGIKWPFYGLQMGVILVLSNWNDPPSNPPQCHYPQEIAGLIKGLLRDYDNALLKATV